MSDWGDQIGAPNRILVVHNYYKLPGGEDVVFERDWDLLKRRGHDVVPYIRRNHEIDARNPLQGLSLPVETIWSRKSARELKKLIRDRRPEIAHFHNTFPLISPSVYSSCREEGIPIVQSIHNPRLMCPAATLFRNGKLCVDCLGKSIPWPGVLHACYRESRLQTSVVAATTSLHRLRGTWQKDVDLFMVATDFYRRLLIANGFPAEKLAVKPHFVFPDPGYRGRVSGDYGLYIGRLEAVKGIWTLLEAWSSLTNFRLLLRGGGPELDRVRTFLESRQLNHIRLIEPLDSEGLTQLLKGARMLIWPSNGYYETFGLVQTEAFACGVPVVASNIGVGTEIVKDGWNGLHFKPGDPEDLREKIISLFGDPLTCYELGKNARIDFETNYTDEQIYPRLIDCYRQALGRVSLPLRSNAA
jgi:glycosyltransferase involved in cell wall biosynthesis